MSQPEQQIKPVDQQVPELAATEQQPKVEEQPAQIAAAEEPKDAAAADETANEKPVEEKKEKKSPVQAIKERLAGVKSLLTGCLSKKAPKEDETTGKPPASSDGVESHPKEHSEDACNKASASATTTTITAQPPTIAAN